MTYTIKISYKFILIYERFVTRPDVKKEKLAEFLDWSLIGMDKANGLYC